MKSQDETDLTLDKIEREEDREIDASINEGLRSDRNFLLVFAIAAIIVLLFGRYLFP